jgi:hypothetical protein
VVVKGAHDRLKWLLMLTRNRCSRSSEIRAHDAVKSVLTIPRNTQPKIGEGLVIPRDSRFIDLDRGEGTLKVPAGISLQEQGSR